MGIKLIVTDLDGTLLTSQQTVSPRTLATLAAARAQGVYVTVATGRMYIAAAHYAKLIGANAPVICCNGSMVRDVPNNKSLFEMNFSAKLTEQILTECYANDWYVQWYIDDQIYAPDFRPEMFKYYKQVAKFNLNEVGSKFALYTDRVIQIVVRDRQGRIVQIQEQLRERFGDLLELQQNTDISVDITPRGINKAVGLAQLSKYLGIKQSEIMAFGDADNDLAMLEYAGMSVVTANGIAKARALADFITADCDNDGVAKAIELYVLSDR